MPVAKPSFPRLNLSHPLAQGLQLAWAMYDGGGKTVNDLSGNLNSGSITGTTSWAGGQSGWALSLDKSTSNVQASFVPISDAANTTLAAWFNPSDNSGFQVVLSLIHAGSSASWNLYAIANGNSLLNYIDNSGVQTTLTNASTSINTWHHLVGTCGKSGSNVTLSMWVDGVLAGRSTAALGANNGFTYAGVGQLNGSGSQPEGGFVDSAFVWNRVLSDAEILQLYEDSYAMFRLDDNWYKFGAAGGTTFTRSLSDNIAVSDAPISRFANTFRSFSENIGVTDQQSRLANALRSLSENIGVSDAVIRLANALRQQQDNIGVTDSQARFVQSFRAVLDSLGITDSVPGRLASAFRVTSDNIGIADSQARFAQSFRALLDNLGVTDAQTAKLATGIIWHLMVIENIGLGELFTRRIPVSRIVPISWGPLPGRIKFPTSL